MKRVYLDFAATTPVDPEVFDAMKPYFLEKFGNPSSIHKYGQETKAAIEDSRNTIAKGIGATPAEVVFVSSGTESDNYALKGVASVIQKKGKNHIITSKVEHHAILETCEYLAEHGFSVTYVPVDEYGRVNPEDIKKAIRPETGLISIMYANNEVGSINPISEIGTIAKESEVLFHTDAVQAFGKMKIDVDDLNVDLLSITAHKLYGPKGIGALYIRKGVEIKKLLHGGGQERGRRAGTESTPLIVGFAKAVEVSSKVMENDWKRISALKTYLKSKLQEKFSFVLFNGHPEFSLPNILSVSFDSSKINLDGEALILSMDVEGVAIASGSACTSGSVKPSHVLIGMGRDVETVKATIRFSMGRQTIKDDLDYAMNVLEKTILRIGKSVHN